MFSIWGSIFQLNNCRIKRKLSLSLDKHLQSYLKGHSGLVTAMSWSADDSVLVSCADDGSLYEWDISDHGKRVNELVIKSCSYSDVVLTSK